MRSFLVLGFLLVLFGFSQSIAGHLLQSKNILFEGSSFEVGSTCGGILSVIVGFCAMFSKTQSSLVLLMTITGISIPFVFLMVLRDSKMYEIFLYLKNCRDGSSWDCNCGIGVNIKDGDCENIYENINPLGFSMLTGYSLLTLLLLTIVFGNIGSCRKKKNEIITFTELVNV